MDELKKRVLNQTIKTLENLKVKYFIVDEDGNRYGNDIDKRKRRPLQYPFGEISKYINSQMIDFPPPGEWIVINCGKYKPQVIQSSLSAKANKSLGTGAITTTTNDKDNTVKIYRVF